ncbi:MAG TPA: 5,6-dimethylbenzimidazole synthase [Acidimicrobiales bacterium]|nr:5,6-dimethylbenzimidazole synthase [Acidimicrobiales bacterium]
MTDAEVPPVTDAEVVPVTDAEVPPGPAGAPYRREGEATGVADGHRWARPIPLVGDGSSASERAAAPEGWRLPPDDAAAVYGAMLARRDVRRFRSDAVPEDVLRRVLRAAHAAPSVGHSQPWRFIIVREPDTRDRASLCAEREQLRQASLLEERAARQLLDLQLNGIREAPVGVVVCCDRRVDPVAVLGRATFPDADLWSCACAIENLWLAARAEGLGVGWVTLFQPTDLARLVLLPPGVATLGWLCVGWPDERPPEPGLERAGWSIRQPLDQVVFAEHWPSADRGEADNSPGDQRGDEAGARPGDESRGDEAGARPGDEAATPAPAGASQRAMAANVARAPSTAPPPAPAAPLPRAPVGAPLRAPEPRLVVGARDEADELLSAPGSLGALDRALARVRALGLSSSSPAALVLAGTDHPVTLHGVSTYPSSVTREVLEAAVAGEALGAAAARAVGASVLTVDAGVDGTPVRGAWLARPECHRGDLVRADAMAPCDVSKLISRGEEVVASIADGLGPGARPGLVLLGEVAIGNTTVATTLWAALAELDESRAAASVGLGASGDSPTIERKRSVVRAALRRARSCHGEALGRDPLLALACLGGPELAVLAGAALGTARRGGCIVLDGMATSVAALVAVRLHPGVAAHLVAGHVSNEQSHRAVLAELGVEPLLDLRIRAGEGVGAALAAGMLRTALLMRERAGKVASHTRP